MELKQLQYFVVSVDMGSFKKAAEVLFTSQPHISKTIKSLEEELNTELLNRYTSGVTMTEAGKQVYAYASSILKKIDEISQVGGDRRDQKLCVSAMFDSKLEDLFAEFYQASGDGNNLFQYMEGTVEDIMGHLHHRVSEIGFVFISERQFTGFIQELNHKRLEFIELQKMEPCLVVGKKNFLYGEKCIDASVLNTVKLIQVEENFYSLSIHPGHLKEEFPINNSEQKAIMTNSESLVMSLLEKTDLGIVCSYFLPGMYERCDVHVIPLKKFKESIFFGIIKRSRDELSPMAQSLMDYIKKRLL